MTIEDGIMPVAGGAAGGHGDPDVVVVGAGVVGASTARELARGGARVLLVDRDEHPGAGSRAAAGVGVPSVRLLGDAAMMALAREGERVLAADLDRLAGPDRPLHRACGVLRPARDADEAARLRADAAGHEDMLGEWVPAARLPEHEPGWQGKVHGAFRATGARVVDAAGYVDALVAEAVAAGVEVRTATAVHGWKAGADGVVVDLPGTTVSAGRLVLACGAWSGDAARDGDGAGAVPVRPVRGQMLRLGARPDQVPRHVVSGALYLAPAADGAGVLVGATEEDVGFAPGPSVEGALLLLAHVARTFPGLRDATVERIWHGYRAATPDRRPLIGPLPGAERVVVAAGHGGQGILTGGHTGHLVAALVAGARPEGLDAFDPARAAG